MTLYLFTSSFPYGNVESFLEDEILYLCEEFEKVEIIPLTGNVNIQREVPFNCHVNVPI